MTVPPANPITLNRQPRLACALVQLRPMTEADWPALFAAAADPMIWAGHPANDRWQEPVFRAYVDDALASGGGLVAVDPADGSILGASRYDLDRAGPGEIEIGWSFLVRRAWGGPINAAVKALMVGHALTSADRVIFLVGESNGRSRRAMEKIGGRLTSRVSDVAMAGGVVRHVVYAIDHDDFAHSPLAKLAEAAEHTH